VTERLLRTAAGNLRTAVAALPRPGPARMDRPEAL